MNRPHLFDRNFKPQSIPESNRHDVTAALDTSIIPEGPSLWFPTRSHLHIEPKITLFQP